MDIRLMLVVLSLSVLVGWLYRRRTHAGASMRGGESARRRSSDRTISGRGLDRLYGTAGDSAAREAGVSAGDTLAESVAKVVTADTDVDSGVHSDPVPEPEPAPATLRDADSPIQVLRNGNERRRKPLRDVAACSDARMAEINRLKELLRQRDRKLTRNRHAMEEVDKLKRKLHEKGREMEMLQQACARSDAALAHYRNKGQHAALLEQQLCQLRETCRVQAEELRQRQQGHQPAEKTSAEASGNASANASAEAPAKSSANAPVHAITKAPA